MVTQLRPDLFVKKDDTRPHLDVALEDEEGFPMNLTGATITFSMRDAATKVAKVTNSSCTVLDALRGEVRHSWTTSMTDTEGVFEGEFQVTDFESRVQTFPSSGFVVIVIVESI